MKGIVTVLGKDRVGLIAKVCTYLSDNGMNILDISQSVVGGYFNMMMIVDLDSAIKPFDLCQDELDELGKTLAVAIKLQHEDIFNSMHKI